MILLNFSHPLTEAQVAQVEALTQEKITGVERVFTQFDNDAPFMPQLHNLMANLSLSPDEWQELSILVNLPSYNFVAALLLAELHGRMGYFPPIIRLRPVKGALPPRYEVAEVLNLQETRNEARKLRKNTQEKA
jgi:hypothetical protein